MNKKNLYFGLYHTLGDIVVSTAIIRAIRAKYPDSHITYATSKDNIDVLENNPDVDEVIATSHPYEVVLRANEKPYDKIYLPLQLTHEDSVWHQRPDWCVDNGDNHNLVDFYASRCNDDLKITDRRTFLFPQERHFTEVVDRIPEELREKFNAMHYITMHTTSRNPSKDWPIERFKELAHRINNKYGSVVRILQIGGPDDPDIDTKVVSSFKGLPILNTAALLSKSLFHIDIDSGPSFIADSVGTPTICIMAATWSQTSGPIGPNVTFIEPSVRECIGANTHTPCHATCMIKPRECKYNVSVDEVFDKFVEKFELILQSQTTSAGA